MNYSGQLVNSILFLLGYHDYFDYFRNDRRNVKAGYRFESLKVDVSGGVNFENHSSLAKTTDDNILGRDRVERENPAIQEGRLRSVTVSLGYGDEYIPIITGGRKRIEFELEYSSPDFLPGDFSFTRYRTTIDWRFNTFFRRGLLPNTLDIRIIGGAFSGDLPIQRFGIIDSRSSGMSPFGTLRSLKNRPLEGEKYCALFLEHNFGAIPFEMAGLRWLARQGTGIILYGASGRTWIGKSRLAGLNYSPNYADSFHSEIGFSVNALYGTFRIDVTKRLDKRGLYFGFGMARRF